MAKKSITASATHISWRYSNKALSMCGRTKANQQVQCVADQY
jgi:hypothetical protein